MAMKCVSYLPFIVSASVLNASVFATCLFGYVLAGEKLSKEEMIAVTGGFAGVVLLLNPTLFSGMSGAAMKTRMASDLAMYPRYNLGLVFGVLFSVFASMKMITIRAIGDNVHPSLKNYYFGVLSTVTALVTCAINTPNFFKPWLIGTAAYPLSLA